MISIYFLSGKTTVITSGGKYSLYVFSEDDQKIILPALNVSKGVEFELYTEHSNSVLEAVEKNVIHVPEESHNLQRVTLAHKITRIIGFPHYWLVT